MKLRNANVVSRDQISRNMSDEKIFHLKSALQEIRSKLNSLKEIINSTKGINNTYDTIIIQGSGEFEGKIITKEIEVDAISGESATNLLNDIVK